MVIKYQLRVNESAMSDKPWDNRPMTESREEALGWLEEARKEIRETWATPDEKAAYVKPWAVDEHGKIAGGYPPIRLQPSGVVNIDID